MAAQAEKSEAKIFKVDTVPPPPGEDSAYDAPTKVGPMARAAIQHLFAAAEPAPAATERPPASGIHTRASHETTTPQPIPKAPQVPAFAAPPEAPPPPLPRFIPIAAPHITYAPSKIPQAAPGSAAREGVVLAALAAAGACIVGGLASAAYILFG